MKSHEISSGFKMTELGPLPEEWKMIRLEDVTEKPQYGYTALQLQATGKGGHILKIKF